MRTYLLRLAVLAFTLVIASGCGNAETAHEKAARQKNTAYEVAGIRDQQAFMQMVAEVQVAVAADDAEKLARHILYPMRVNGGAVTEISDKEALVAQYKQVFSDKMKGVITAGTPESLFANEQGVMAGLGEVWFGATTDQPQKYGIIAVNVPVE
ncbi:hypothetical protein SY83_10115 [Paenibacillus swuensis]|uniref:Uncharacterized protein n=1 Tax=Paenibacillus swuensis TaxID=1178515 RepID=A0A172THN5_9BACL|nr:hypothetical protein [Paenibacillus swuensis]ANE46569.1 hypothetical protein SY83_10115 [Paenibacillus swuensis]